MTLTGRTRDQLDDVLERARRAGYLGPGPIADHVEHALGFATTAGDGPAAVPAFAPAREKPQRAGRRTKYMRAAAATAANRAMTKDEVKEPDTSRMWPATRWAQMAPRP